MFHKFHKIPFQIHEKICGLKLDNFAKKIYAQRKQVPWNLSRHEVTRGFVTLQYPLYKVLAETRATYIQYGGRHGGLLGNSARYSTV